MIFTDPFDDRSESAIGSAIAGRAMTAVLFVSPNGDDSDGSTWGRAYTTVQGALDAASTDPNECTAIMIGPHPTFYDIDTAGTPTWTGNYELIGPHRLWAPIRNEHASADWVLKFTGKASLRFVSICHGPVNGVTFTTDGFRVRECCFDSQSATGPVTAIYADGTAATIRDGSIENMQVAGHVSHTTGLHLNAAAVTKLTNLSFWSNLVGCHIEDAESDTSRFNDVTFSSCALGLDIDSGNDQDFHHLNFNGCTRNIDDEVGDHHYENIRGHFPIIVDPDNFVGITVPSAIAADTWGALTELVAANAIDNPFRVVGVTLDPAVSQWARIRLTGDGGAIYFDDIMFEGSKQASLSAPSGTGFTFNANAKVEAQVKVISGGPDNVVVWLQIQVI